MCRPARVAPCGRLCVGCGSERALSSCECVSVSAAFRAVCVRVASFAWRARGVYPGFRVPSCRVLRGRECTSGEFRSAPRLHRVLVGLVRLAPRVWLRGSRVECRASRCSRGRVACCSLPSFVGGIASALRVRVRRFVAGYLVDPASSHMLVSKIKPCMSKYKRLVL